MGDSLEIGSNIAVNGITFNADKRCLSSNDVEHFVSDVSSGDLLVKGTDDIDGTNDTAVKTGQSDELVPLHVTASPSVHNENENNLNLSAKNCVVDDAANSNSCRNSESEPSLCVNDKHQRNAVSGNGCDHGEAYDEHCLDRGPDPNDVVRTSSSSAEVVNFSADDGNVESLCTVLDDTSSHQQPESHVTSDMENSVIEYSKAEDLPSVLTNKSGENHHTGESHVVVDSQFIKPECEDDVVKTVSGNAETEKTGDNGLACELGATSDTETAKPDLQNPTAKNLQPITHGTDEDPETSYSVSSSQISTVPVATSSFTSSSTVTTVVISTPSLSSASASGLLARVLSVTSSTGAARPTQLTDKPLVVSVSSSSTTICNSSSSGGGSTRLMSKVLQDAGLLLVSQRVFKNLASIQKHKLHSNQKQSDTALLEKLKTSHQNLVAKNHGLLTAERKCWCGYRSESVNVLEAHRLVCDSQGRCCYCSGEFVYRTPKQMKTHLWKVHKKLGNVVDRVASYKCIFCPQDFASRLCLLRHMADCRRRFLLAKNLAPKEDDKDIPVTAASKNLQKVSVKLSSPPISPHVTVSQNMLRTTSVSSAALMTPAIMPPVNLRFVPAIRNSVPAQVIRTSRPAPQLLQIGKHLLTLYPSTTLAAPVLAVTPSSAVKTVSSSMTLNSAVQTALNTSAPIPKMVSKVNSRIANQASVQATTVPASVLRRSLQYNVCPVCSAFVKDKATLFIHMNVVHGSTHKMCRYCYSADITFPNLTELNAHIQKFHTSDCWLCKSRFQPPDQLINHFAGRHKVTMAKMLEFCRCYFCSSVPKLPTYVAFEEHMMKQHSLQFRDVGRLWERIVHSPNADRNWYARRNADGTFECPVCHGQFISNSFMYRHLHLEHNGKMIRLVHCYYCGQRLPSNLLTVHLVSAHTRKCSVKLSRVDMPVDGCMFIPPVGTKRLKNRRGESVTGCPPLKRVKSVEMVVISDDDDENDRESFPDDSESLPDDSEGIPDDSNDEDFMVRRLNIVRSERQLRRSIRTRTDCRKSSVDDVCEVLESIVDSGMSEPEAKPPVGFTGISMSRVSPSASAAAQLSNGITEDEVEIIESIVPTVRHIRRTRPPPLNKPIPVEPADRNYVEIHSMASESSTDYKLTDVRAASNKSNSELVLTECQNEIIGSVVPMVRRRHQPPLNKPKHVEPVDRNYVEIHSTASETSIDYELTDVHAASNKSDSELVSTECRNGDCHQPSTKQTSALSQSSAQQLMARDQIMTNSVEEVLEIDGETVLIVHDNDDDEDEDED